MLQRTNSRDVHPYRLVVETDDPALAISDFRCFKDAGFDVVVCHGPDGTHPCPAVTGEGCAAVADADVVYNALADAEQQRTVLAAVRKVAPAVPMVVNVAPGLDDELPEGCIPLARTASVSGQTHAVRQAAVLNKRRARVT